MLALVHSIDSTYYVNNPCHIYHFSSCYYQEDLQYNQSFLPPFQISQSQLAIFYSDLPTLDSILKQRQYSLSSL